MWGCSLIPGGAELFHPCRDEKEQGASIHCLCLLGWQWGQHPGPVIFILFIFLLKIAHERGVTHGDGIFPAKHSKDIPVHSARATPGKKHHWNIPPKPLLSKAPCAPEPQRRGGKGHGGHGGDPSGAGPEHTPPRRGGPSRQPRAEGCKSGAAGPGSSEPQSHRPGLRAEQVSCARGTARAPGAGQERCPGNRE